MPELALHVEDEAGHVLGLREAHAGHRLVEQQELGLHRQRPAELDPLLDAVREQRHRVLAPAARSRGSRRCSRPGAGCSTSSRRAGPEHNDAGQPRPLMRMWRPDQQVVDDGHLGEQLDVLERAGDAAFGHLVGTQAHDALALPADVAACGRYTWEMALKIEVLPAPLGPMMANSSPGPDVEADVVDGGHATEPQGDVRRPRAPVPTRSAIRTTASVACSA